MLQWNVPKPFENVVVPCCSASPPSLYQETLLTMFGADALATL